MESRQHIESEQIALVRENWRVVEQEEGTFIQDFYDRLFRIDPSTRKLFSDNMADQRQKFLAVIRTLIRHLDQPDDFRQVLGGLGGRHTHYGVQREHFESMRKALIETLEAQLGGRFTALHQEAWDDAFRAAAGLMTEAMPETDPARNRTTLGQRVRQMLSRDDEPSEDNLGWS